MIRRVVAYDFDGTITNTDTFPAFILHAKGRWRFIAIFLLFSPLLILMKLKLYSADKTKERLFSYVFKGTDYCQFTKWSREFASLNKDILRPKALASISHFKGENETSIYIVSAGIKEWIVPFFEANKFTAIISTEVEVNSDGKLTGRFKTKNCNRSEKVQRLLTLEPDRASYELVAFGDSQGDKELIDFADYGYYNAFN